MTIVLYSTPATADDVAEILGVPKKRVKWLKRLMQSRTAATIRANRGKVKRKNGLKVTLAGKKTKASHVKTKKVAR
jgi:ribosomal protein L14E/L6E/L27E